MKENAERQTDKAEGKRYQSGERSGGLCLKLCLQIVRRLVRVFARVHGGETNFRIFSSRAEARELTAEPYFHAALPSLFLSRRRRDSRVFSFRYVQESYRRIVSHSSCVEKLLARQGKKPELTLRGEMEELRQELISPSLNDDMRVVDSSKKSLLPR